MSEDLGAQCKLHFGDVGQAPKFGYDEFTLMPADRTVLDQIATCVTSGPLKGHTLHLVGRADPRGTEEYNLGLGDRRARAVTDYLERLGVGSKQITSSTRGALDASGADDASWQIDRRVDVSLD